MKTPTKTLAILTYGFHKPLGSFSKGYIEDLPYKKIVLFGGLVPFLLMGTPKWKQKLIRYIIAIKALNNPIKIEKLKEKRLIRILKKNKVDCALAEFLNTGAFVKPACEKLRIPLISNVLGYEINDSTVVSKFRDKYLALGAYQAFTIPVARDMIPELLDLGFKKETIFYSPIGPTNSFFKIEPDYNSNQFIFIGRMAETKSPLNLIYAFKKVVEKFPEAKMVMAGDGKLMDDVKALIKKLNLSDNISLPGWITREQQLDFYTTSFCYVQHSVTTKSGEREGTPVSILEASAAGLPVISTIHAGIPDIIIQNKTGLLVNENDIERMANEMLVLYRNRLLAKQLGQEGKKNVQTNYSLDAHLALVEKLINCAIKQ